MRVLIILTAVSLLVTGCATPPEEHLTKLSLGMSKEQVLDKMGAPDSVKAKGAQEVLVYIHEGTFWTWGHGIRPTREFWVVMTDGKLTQYGQAGDFGTSATPTQNVNLNVKTTSTNP